MTAKTTQVGKRVAKGTRTCRRCKTHRGIIRAYGLYVCRRCFREIAPELGFNKDK